MLRNCRRLPKSRGVRGQQGHNFAPRAQQCWSWSVAKRCLRELLGAGVVTMAPGLVAKTLDNYGIAAPKLSLSSVVIVAAAWTHGMVLQCERVPPTVPAHAHVVLACRQD